MTPAVENLKLVELGSELIAEADFQGHRISVRCIYDPQRWCWIYLVFLVDDHGLRRVSDVHSQLRSPSRLNAVQMGMHLAVKYILGIKEQSVMLKPFSAVINADRDIKR